MKCRKGGKNGKKKKKLGKTSKNPSVEKNESSEMFLSKSKSRQFAKLNELRSNKVIFFDFYGIVRPSIFYK